MSLTRRDFARATAMTALSYSRVLGANDRVALGLVGAGDRGTYVMSLFQQEGNVDVVAICDVFGDHVERARAKATGAKPYGDHRVLLGQPGLDAVLVATPDHWHKGVAVDALNAGKDVYCEKPLVRHRHDGLEILRAARVNHRVCQVGMQQRSGRIYLEAKQRFIDSGALGKIKHATCTWNAEIPDPLPAEPKQKPANLDWVRFLGPVNYRDWNPGMYLDFRAFLDFGGGKMTDFGAHWIDVVHMFTGVDSPLSVSSHGGIFYDNHDGRTAPDTISALFTYPGFTVQFESLALANGGPEYGVTFYGERGRLFITRHRSEFWPLGAAGKPAPPSVRQQIPGDITQDHVHNFLECVKSRKLPNGDVQAGHRSAQACLLAVQAYEENRTIHFDPTREEILPL
jgi:predicted dehydrogenase